MKTFLALSLSDVGFIMLIYVKMPTIIVGILTFMSRIKFVLSLIEHGKSFKTSGPEVSTYRPVSQKKYLPWQMFRNVHKHLYNHL